MRDNEFIFTVAPPKTYTHKYIKKKKKKRHATSQQGALGKGKATDSRSGAVKLTAQAIPTKGG